MSDKIVCLGKNYLEHARELGEMMPESPVIFIKPFSCLMEVKDHAVIPLPLEDKGDIQHELEVVMKIKKDFPTILNNSKLGPLSQLSQLEEWIEGVTLGLDMTKRDLQLKLKQKSHPWTIAKVFEYSAIVGPFFSVKKLQERQDQPYLLRVNGKVRQEATLKEMVMPLFSALTYIHSYFPLKKGDLIFTGTPSGVAAINDGDEAELIWEDFSYRIIWKK